MRLSWMIENTSRFRTEDLRNIFKAVLKRVSKYHKFPHKRYRIRVRGRRHGHSTGHAYLNRNKMVLTIPDNHPAWKVAWLFEHEHYHCLGFDHKDMSPRTMIERHPDNATHYSYLGDLPLRPKEPPKRKPKTPVAERNERHARKMLEKAKRDLASAERRVRKWADKTRYYDRKALKIVAGTDMDKAA